MENCSRDANDVGLREKKGTQFMTAVEKAALDDFTNKTSTNEDLLTCDEGERVLDRGIAAMNESRRKKTIMEKSASSIQVSAVAARNDLGISPFPVCCLADKNLCDVKLFAARDSSSS